MENKPENKLNRPEKKCLLSCLLYAALQLLSEMQTCKSETEKCYFWMQISTFNFLYGTLFLADKHKYKPCL